MVLSLNIIGAGNLGKTLGHLLVEKGLVILQAVCNTSIKSSNDAIQWIGAGKAYGALATLPAADLTLIAVPDDLIEKVAKKLSKNKFLKPKGVFWHCSGSLSSNALQALKSKNCYTASAHPLRSFADPLLSARNFFGTFVALEGDDEALLKISQLFQQIGATTFNIDINNKVMYHIAAIFAANYPVTLAQQALLCMQSAGIEKDLAMLIITSLMQGTVTNLMTHLSPEHSLTGPLKRNDYGTITKHIQAIENSDQKELYCLLAKATLPLIKNKQNEKLIAVLTDNK